MTLIDNTTPHFCLDCLVNVVGPRGSETVLKFAKEINLDEKDFWVLLQTANLAFSHGTGLEASGG